MGSARRRSGDLGTKSVSFRAVRLECPSLLDLLASSIFFVSLQSPATEEKFPILVSPHTTQSMDLFTASCWLAAPSVAGRTAGARWRCLAAPPPVVVIALLDCRREGPACSNGACMSQLQASSFAAPLLTRRSIASRHRRTPLATPLTWPRSNAASRLKHRRPLCHYLGAYYFTSIYGISIMFAPVISTSCPYAIPYKC